ncbi:MAG: gliding motility-associated C-terminal domain-containing protein [Cytophagaceae bacterium]|nr:gliding motility-associated C-terminal domain-containing protein [Cytophagaceae bacterium]
MRIIAILFFLLGNTLIFAQTTYYSRSSGNWNDPSIWSTVGCGVATNTGTFPQTGDNVFVCHNILINANSNCANITVYNLGILEYNNVGSYTLTISGGLNIDNGGVFRYQSNASRIHGLTVAGGIINNGSINFFYDANDYVLLTLNGGSDISVSGSGTWNLFSWTINKSSKTAIASINTATFFANFNGGTFTLTQGTYRMAASGATHNVNPSANFTINQNSIIRIDNNGAINFAQSASMLVLQGRLELLSGAVTVGSTNGAAPNGIRYEQVGGIVPELIQHNGTINVYQGITYRTSTAHPFLFNLYNGTLNLNLGNTASNTETFRINDVANSIFYQADGNIQLYRPNSASLSDFNVCGTAGVVNSAGGTVRFGQPSTPNNSIFRFTPYTNAVLPNFRVSGPATDSVVVKPSTSGNFKLRSLYIESRKAFDISHNSNLADNRTMTLTSTYDGTYAFFDANNSALNYFVYRNSTVEVEGNSTVKVNDGETYSMRFYNLRCAYAGFTTSIKQTTGVQNILYTMGGTLLASDGWQDMYFDGNNPFTITAGSDFLVGALILNKWNASQNIPGYTYNTVFVIAGNANNTYMQGDVTCNALYVNGDNIPGRTCTFYTNNFNLTLQYELVVGAPSGTSNVKRFFAGTSVVTIGSYLELREDAEFHAQSSTVQLYGNWINNALVATNRGFNSQNSKVIFSGGATTLSCLNGPEDFYEMQMSKSAANLTLNTPILVNYRFTFSNGKVVGNSTNHVTFGSGLTHSGASANSFIHAPLRYTGAGTLIFPVGKNTRYRPATIYSTIGGTGTDIHRIEYFDVSPDPPYSVASRDASISSVSTCEYWMMQKESGTASGQVRLSYNASGSCNTASFANFGVARWDGSAWRDLGGSGGAGRTGDATAGSEQTSVNTNFNGPYTHCVETGPTITPGGPTTFCTGNTVLLTSSAGPNYLWSTGATTQSITVSASGNYTVTVSGLISSPVAVTVISAPAAPVASPVSICENTSATLTASGSPNDYNWYTSSSGGVPLGTGASFTTPILSSSTTYYVSSFSGSCESLTRTAVPVNVRTKPTLTTNVSSTFSCGNTVLTALTSGIGNAIRLDGTDDYLAAPSGVYFNADYTIEAWVNLKSLTANQRLLDFGNAAASDNVIIDLTGGAGGRLRFITYKGATPRILQVPISYTPLTLNNWNHIACRIKDSTGTIFINGDSIVSGLLFPGQNVVSTLNYFGRSNTGGHPYAQIDIDEVRIWNTPRTGSQIRANFSSSVAFGNPAIISYLRMEEGTGAVTDDDVFATNTILWNGALWIGNGAPVDVTYNWTPVSGLATTNTRTVLASPTINTTYTVTATYLPGCSNNAAITTNVVAPGDPSVYGNGIWNVYGYKVWNQTSYAGYYTSNPLNIDTKNDWNRSLSPSTAATYQGCTIDTNNFSLSAKRTNFTPGIYEIQVNTNDDSIFVLVDDTLKYKAFTVYNTNRSVWIGTLNATRRVNISMIDFFQAGELVVNFNPVSAPAFSAGSVATSQVLCHANDPAPFTSLAPASGCFIDAYQWQDSVAGGNWTDIAGATLATFNPGVISQTTWYRRKVIDDCYRVGYSNVLEATFQNPLAPSLSGATAFCGTSAISLTASGTEPFFDWYTTPTGGTALFTGSVYSNPALASTTTFYVTSRVGSCESTSRTPITVTINPKPVVSIPSECITEGLRAEVSGADYALDFDGVADYATISNPNLINAGDFTIEAWVKMKSYQSWSALYDFGNGTDADNIILNLSQGTSGRPQAMIYNGFQHHLPAKFDTIPLNQWTHVAFVLRADTGRIYLNGKKVAEDYIALPTNVPRTQNYIGRSSWNNDHSDVLIDQFRIWNYSRTTAQLRAAMNQNLSTAPGLVYNFTMNEGTGVSTSDLVASEVMSLNGVSWNQTSAPTGFTYTWSPSATLSSASDWITYPHTQLSQTYKVVVESAAGCKDSSTVSVNAVPGDTSVYGNGTWNFYCFNRNFETYNGYFTRSALSFNTDTIFPIYTTPSVATGYQGCQTKEDFGIKARRTGFVPGKYSIDILAHDDHVFLSVDGVEVFKHEGCCDAHMGAWTGCLTATSEVECKMYDYFLAGYWHFVFNKIDFTGGAITGNQTICYNTLPAAFTSLSLPDGCGTISYQWQDSLPGMSWNSIAGAIGLTYAPPVLTQTTYYRRVATDQVGQTAASNVVAVLVDNPGTATAADVTICGGYTASFTASGAPGTYRWYDAPSAGTLLYSGNPFTPLATVSDSIYLVVYNGTCEGPSSLVKLIVSGKAPDVSFDKPTYCSTDLIVPNVDGTSNGIQFDGIDDYVQMVPGVYFNGDFTFEAWVHASRFSIRERLLDFGNGSPGDNVIISVNEDYDNAITVKIYQGFAQSSILQSKAIHPYLNNWMHVAYTQSGTIGSIYINGVLSSSGPMLAPLNVVRNQNYLGRNSFWGNPYFQGKLDDVRIWNFARPQADIISNMSVAISPMAAGLMHYWNCNEISGTTITDTRSANNGTLVNGTTFAPGAPLGYSYQWTSTANVSAPTDFAVKISPPVASTYQLLVNNAGCKDSASVLVNPVVAADTAVYGNGTWTSYVYEGFNFDALHGYYQQADLNFNSNNSYNSTLSPSTATGYLGCDVDQQYNSQLIRRTNFTDGIYRLDVLSHDDDLLIRIDNDTVLWHHGCCDSHPSLWVGRLGPASKVDVQLKNRGGVNYLIFTLSPDTPPTLLPGTISANQVVCPGQQPDTLRNTLLASGCSGVNYQWQDSIASGTWTDIAGAIDTFYRPPVLAQTTWFRRVAMDACAQDTFTAAIQITVSVQAVPTASGRSLCMPSSVILVAQGGVNYSWFDAPSAGTLLSSDDSLSTPLVATDTYFYVSNTDAAGCVSARVPVLVEVLPSPPGDTSVFGPNRWNAYVFSGYNFDSYYGYYEINSLSFNIADYYSSLGAPSDYSGYTGCVVPADLHSTRFKRQGFTSSVYRIDFPAHDNRIELWIDGRQVFVDTLFGVPNYNAWTGALNSTSQVEVRLRESFGPTTLQCFILPVVTALPPVVLGDVNKDTIFCESGIPDAFYSTKEIPAHKDAFVFEGNQTTNYGSDVLLRCKTTSGTLNRYSFVTFDMAGIAGPVESAFIRIQAVSSGGNEKHQLLGVYEMTDTIWSESAVNFTNRPGRSALIDTVRVYEDERILSLEVSDYLNANLSANRRYVSFAFEMIGIGINVIQFYSRESSVNPIRLVVNQSASPCFTTIQWQEDAQCTGVWSDIAGAQSDTYQPAAPISQRTCYRKYISDACGRSDTSNVIVVSIDSLTISGALTGSNVVCRNAGSVTLTLNGYRSDQFTWQRSFDNLSFATIPGTNPSLSVNNLNDTAWYRVIAQNGICLKDTSSAFQLNAVESDAGNASNDTLVCEGGTATAYLANLRGNVLKWESSTTNFASVTNLGNSNDSLQVTVTQAQQVRAIVRLGSCPADTSLPISISMNPIPNLVLTNPDPVCSPSSTDLTDPLWRAGSDPGLTISYWQDATAQNALINPSAVSVSGTYYIKGEDAIACAAVQSITVQVDPVPVIAVTNPSARCAPYTVNLTDPAWVLGSDAGLNYSYFTDAGATVPVASPASVATSGTYYLVGTTLNACADTVPVTVQVYPAPAYSLSSELRLLKGNNSATLAITGHSDPISEWQWSLDDFQAHSSILSNTTSAHQLTNVSDSSWYRVVLATSNCGNYPTLSIPVRVYRPMQFRLPDTIQVYKNLPYQASVSLLGTVSFQDPYTLAAYEDTLWSTPLGSMQLASTGLFTYFPPANYLGLDSIDFQICATDLSMPYCASHRIYFEVIEKPKEPGPLEVYTSFSPNQDGVNDAWVIRNIEFFPDNTVRILDRWGNLVYEAQGYDNEQVVWSGEGRKGKLPDDTYYFVLEVNDKIEKTGYVVLKR